MDDAGDNARDDTGVWLTYDELADARAISRAAARRLAQRRHWRRQPGNDGLARVLVPPEGAQPPRDTPRVSQDAPRAPEVDIAGVVAALRGAIDTLRLQLLRADAQADELRAERDALRQAEAARRGQGRWARLKAAWRCE